MGSLVAMCTRGRARTTVISAVGQGYADWSGGVDVGAGCDEGGDAGTDVFFAVGR